MKKRSLVVVIAMLMLMPVFMTGCSRDDVAIVRIELVNVPQGELHSSNSVSERIFRWFVPNAWAVSQWTTHDTIQIILSAPDLLDTSFTMPSSQTNFTMEVPAGLNRKITVFGYSNPYGKEWGGHAELDLSPGDEKDVQINMLPWTNVSSVSPSTDIQISWSAVGAIYGVLGHRVYRAENAEGPYSMVIQNSNPSSGSALDNPAKGKTYYYKVSVYTATSEGELSDSKSIYWP